MSKPISLFEANRYRAQCIAEHCASRLPDPGLWAGYTKHEELVGELRFHDQINYWRRGSPHAVLVFRQPTMTDIKEVDWGKPETVSSDIIERYNSTIKIDKAVHYTDTITHTFSKTRSLLEAAKVGAEVSIKTALAAEYAGVKGSVEVAARISAEYSRQWGTSETQTDTVQRALDVQGPITVNYEAVRSIDKMQRQITAIADFTYGISLIDETGAGVNPPRIFLNWASYGEFLSVVDGLAPANHMVGPPGHQSMQPMPLYHEFLNRHVTAAEREELGKPSDAKVQFTVEYDNVNSQNITIL